MTPRVTQTMMVAVVGTVVVLGALAATSTASAGRPEIRQIDVSAFPRIQITVVVPADTRTAPTLSENGTPAVGLISDNLGQKESVSLVLDHSRSMHGRALAEGIRAAEAFVAAKPGPDQISIVGVASQALSLSDFSASQAVADDALNSLSVDPRYGTALWDSVVLAANRLRTHGLSGRAIILVTDGQETTSDATLVQAIHAALSARARIYAIGIPDTSFAPAPLVELARATGGRSYRAPSTAALVRIYRLIAADLDRTWQLQFLTADRPGDTLRLAVKAAGASATGSMSLPSSLGNATGTTSSLSRLIVALLAIVGALAIILLASVIRSMRPIRWLRRASRRLTLPPPPDHPHLQDSGSGSRNTS
jgi:hypothetical protein